MGSGGCVRRYCAGVRLWKSSGFDYKHLRGEMEDVGELEVVRRESMLDAEGDGGDGAELGEIVGVVLRGEREQGDDNRGQADGDHFLHRAVCGAINALR